MEAERMLRYIEDEMRRRGSVKGFLEVKNMTDEELIENRSKCLKERDVEFKRCGWLK